MFRYRSFARKIVKSFSVASMTTMPSPHLATGSKEPPRVEGKLRLYSMEYCPYVQRVRLVLNAKNIPYDVVNIDLVNRPQWYFKFHPEGKVPAIDTGSEVLIESLDISDFLDENYPQYPLYPNNVEAKKQDKELITKIGPLTNLFYLFVLKRPPKSEQEWASDFEPLLQEFESELSKRGTFFGGARPGMVDYMLWPWGERSQVVPLIYSTDLFPAQKYPFLWKWREAMLEDPPSKAIYYRPEIHLKLIEARQRRQPPDYNNFLSHL